MTRRAGTVVGSVLVLLALLGLGPVRAASAQPGGGRALLVGAPGLRWDDVGPRTPALAALAASGSTGALSVRSAGPRTCAADGWVMAGAGNRARVGRLVDGPCTDPPPGRDVLPEVARDNAGLRVDNEVGALGRVVDGSGGCLAALGGPGAELATGVAAGPLTAASLAAAAGRCAAVVVDAGAVHHDGRLPADLARVDAAVGLAVSAARGSGSVLLVAGLADTSDTTAADDGPPVPRLHVAVASGPGFPVGGLVSASTRRAPYVQVVDVAPTVLRVLGLPQPETMTGQPWTGAAARTSRAGLVDLDRLAGQMRRYTPRFFVLLVALQILIYGGGLLLFRRLDRQPLRERVRSGLGVAALAFTAAPVATYLANLLPWWRADPVLPALLGAVALFDALVVALALAGPWRRSVLGPVGVVCASTAGVLAVDLVTGARLQMGSLAGYSPLVAGRFAGVGNVAFAVFATGVLLATATVLAGRRRRAVLAVCGGVGLAAVVVDGGPQFGSDFGGVLALVPGFAVLAMLCGGIRVSAVRLLAVGLSGVALVTAFAVYDHSRPPDAQSHLGRFVTQVLDGGALTVVQRKAAANLGLLTSSVLTLLVPVLVLFVAQVVLRPRGAVALAFSRVPTWRAGLVSVLVMALVGFAANDSGVAVPALALTLAVPAALAVVLRASAPGGRSPG